jgi:hypothetical protein
LASAFLFLLPRHHPGVREKLLPGVDDCLLAYCFVGVTGDLQALSCLVSINQQFHQFFSSRPESLVRTDDLRVGCTDGEVLGGAWGSLKKALNGSPVGPITLNKSNYYQ